MPFVWATDACWGYPASWLLVPGPFLQDNTEERYCRDNSRTVLSGGSFDSRGFKLGNGKSKAIGFMQRIEILFCFDAEWVAVPF